VNTGETGVAGDASHQRHDLVRSRGAMPAVGSSSSSSFGALASAIASPAGAGRRGPGCRSACRLLAEPHAFQKRQRLVAVEAARRQQEIEVPAMVAEKGRLHVLQRGETAEDARDLEGAAHPRGDTDDAAAAR
jgi:hypothetical protein